MTEVVSRAVVPTTSAGRYAKQLLSHLGHRVAFTTDGDSSTAVIAGARAEVVVGPESLVLVASGDDAAAVAQAEHVLGSHLERFAHRDGLVVRWERSGPHAPPGAPPHERPGRH